MKQKQGTNNQTDETTNSEANAQVVAHGISPPDCSVDLASATVQYSVYSSCLLLLSSLQLYYMCEEKGVLKKKKKKNSTFKRGIPRERKG
ncbi:hypothetical protein PCOAH_00014090 [Plasmodium coatneyi]|uniref:Uncharacterized protein n=1 Tax=Plasmodium coatneyi TaxID=208452 RepID=A0A1B1DW99_9APIC|nr:hypothetical protein PCOAH_00014090 [Plasmodium coatneyi]ANQ07038.1 hypothetical protein PCOAH_00014090 [Plasmodium coatneyi]